jgi:hypothetical protein
VKALWLDLLSGFLGGASVSVALVFATRGFHQIGKTHLTWAQGGTGSNPVAPTNVFK